MTEIATSVVESSDVSATLEAVAHAPLPDDPIELDEASERPSPR